MSLQVLLFAVVIVSQCVIPSLQLPRTNEQPTVLEIFQKAFVTKNCKTVLIDPNKSDFLDQCNVPVPDLTNNITGSNVISYLCMTYYDVNLKICDRLATDQAKFQSHLPQSKEEIQNITSHFDTVEIADEFCKHNHSNIGQSDYAETKQYVKVFAMAISEQHLCTHACLDFFGKLNSFCKMIFWATLKLSDHDEASTKFTQMDNIIKNSLKHGLSPAVDQHIVPVAAKLPITSKQQETALPEVVANGGSDDFSLISSKELVKNTYETNVVFSAPDRMNSTPIIGGGLPQRPQGPKVDMVPLKTSGKEVSVEKETLLEKTLSPYKNLSPEKTLSPEKNLSPEKTLSPEKNLSPEKTLSPEKNLSPEKTLSPEKINSAEKESTVEKTVPPVKEIPNKTTLDKEAVVVNVPPPAPSKVEEETNNSEDEDMESPTLLDEGANKPDNDFGDDSEPDLPVKGNGEVERGEEREGAESAVGAAGGAAPVENPTIEHIGGQGYTSEGEFVGSEDSHFFPYFLFASSILIVGYIIFHNKNKVLGLLLEGRRGEGRRRCPGGGPAYRKLDCTLEEAVSSAPPSHQPHIVY